MWMHSEVPDARQAGVGFRSAQSTKHQSVSGTQVFRVTPSPPEIRTCVTTRAAGRVGSRSASTGFTRSAMAERTGPKVLGGYASQTVPSTTAKPRALNAFASAR